MKKAKCSLLILSCVVPGLACSTLFGLSSCSYLKPEFFAPSDRTNSWIKGDFAVRAHWDGYYSEDVNEPWALDNPNGVTWNGHQSDIDFKRDSDGNVDTDYNRKCIDPENRDEYIEIWFHIVNNESVDSDKDQFTITINWTVKHASIHKHTDIVIKPYSTIDLHQDFQYTSMPNSDNNYPGDVPLDSYNSVQNLYRIGDNCSVDKILSNLYNDFCYLTQLIFQNLTNVLIDDSIDIEAHTLLGSESVIKVDFRYDQINMIFKYIRLSINAQADIYMLGHYIPGTIGSIEGEYTWGNQSDDSNSGPKLLGAYKMSSGDKHKHFPQDETLPNYSQNFLSLVPSSPDSLMLYNLKIKATIPGMGTIKWEIGTHSYFLTQPRGYGLEFATGHKHLSFVANSSLHADGFRSLSLMIPSCALSGIGYDITQPTPPQRWYQQHNQINIVPCETNINTEGKLFKYLKNYAHQNDGQPENNFAKYLFKSERSWWCDFGNSPPSSYPSHDGLPDWPENETIFLTQRKQLEFDQWSRSVEDEDNPWVADIIDPSNPNNIYVHDVPWYQIIQEPSPASNGGSYDGNSFASYDGDNNDNADSGGSRNIQGSVDGTGQWKFTRFALGLNYMFTCSDVASNSDNVFAYSSTVLTKINELFNAHPSNI